MTTPPVGGAEPFWKTVRLLWRAARRRARARIQHQRRLLRQRKGSSSDVAGGFAIVFTAIFMAFLHGFLAYSTISAIKSAALVAAEHSGRRVVSDRCFESIAEAPSTYRFGSTTALPSVLRNEATRRSLEFGGSSAEEEKILRYQYLKFGRGGFIRRSEVPSKLTDIGRMPALAQLCGTIFFFWWFVMLTMQGEGLELDVQRRRHPMWEWLLSHPVRPQAAFLAEMAAPVVSNPAYLAAPIFWIGLFAQIWEFPIALIAGLIVGLFFAIAAACLNKTLELCAMLKLSVRSRGAALELMSWLGYALFITPLFAFGKPGVLVSIANWLVPVAPFFHPNLLRWFLGNWAGDTFSFSYAVLTALVTSGIVVTACAFLARWGTAQGLEGGFDTAPKTPRLLRFTGKSHFGREPLYRKELLWFVRDRSALVQAILIPLTVAAMQAFNLRHLVATAGESWNGFCGLAVISGTYFLLVLGPRSLTSEGPALWIALTWPRGLEDLLKAKARLWWYLSSVVEFAVLLYAATRYPADAWRIGLVAVGWWIFGRSLAEKAVTLVTAPSSSGEAQPVSRSRRWTAMLGTLAFGSGVVTGNWHLATIGVVFSTLTAAAMWQNLRARLPFLFDPWSEKLPAAPTLLHAMVAIAAMAEGIGLTTAIFIAVGGRRDVEHRSRDCVRPGRINYLLSRSTIPHEPRREISRSLELAKQQ